MIQIKECLILPFNEASQNLYHQAVLTSCDQVVNSQMAFPPGKEIFDVPPEFIGISYLFGCQIPSICGYPIINAINMVRAEFQSFVGL
jgi:hypothetical protein